jgi:FkbH-like protein
VLHLPPPRPIGAIGFGKGGNLRRIDAASEISHRIAALAEGLEGTYLIDLSATPHLAGTWRDEKGLQASLSPIASHAAPLIAQAIARAVAPLFRPRRKVLVLDLDNTLWGGIVGEVGCEGVILGDSWPGAAYVAFQRAVRELAESGVLLALNSKNNEADARAVFDTRPEMILRWNDFAARRVNWQDKAENLASIASDLSLGIDSFVFADDSPVECERIRAAFPEVEVVELTEEPARLVDALLDCPGFDVLSLTDEDRLRMASYRSETERSTLREATGDYHAFLRSLSLEIDIAPCDDGSFERLHQLLLKTNQFHLTLERPTQTELAARRGRLFSIRLRDRFGDYGIIGVLEIVVRRDAFEIVNLALSCRALGRLVEETVLAFVAEVARAAGAAAITARSVVGPRNQPAMDFLEKAGFVCVAEQLVRLSTGHGAPTYPSEAVVRRPEPAILERTC